MRRLINRESFAYAGLAILLFILYFWRLGSLTPGLSQAEIATKLNSSSWQAMLDNPLYAPYHALQYLSTLLGGSTAFYLRLPSAILTVVLLGSLYYLAKTWFGKTVGVLSTLMAASTPLVILSARQATPETLLLMPIALLEIYTWLIKTKTKTAAAWTILCLVAAGALYVPGGIYFVIIGLVFGRKSLAISLSKISRLPAILAPLLGLLAVAPLAYGLAQHPRLVQSLMLLPGDWSPVFDTLRQLGWAVLSIVWQTPSTNDLIIGRLPILDVTQIVLLVFGVFAMTRLARAKIYSLVFLLVLGLIAFSLNHTLIYLMLSLPAIFMFVAAGLRYLFLEWRAVFPNNPIPKYLALALMSLLTGLHISYGLSYSLSAWPNTTQTKSQYMLK